MAQVCTLDVSRQHAHPTPHTRRIPQRRLLTRYLGLAFLGIYIWCSGDDKSPLSNMFPRVLDDRGSHELVPVEDTISQSSVSRQRSSVLSGVAFVQFPLVYRRIAPSPLGRRVECAICLGGSHIYFLDVSRRHEHPTPNTRRVACQRYTLDRPSSEW